MATAKTIAPVGEPGRLRRRAATSLQAFASVFQNRAIRRLQLAWIGSVIGQWSFFVALGVYAFEVGGNAGVGVAGLLRVLPPALGGVFVGGLADRYPRVRVMVASDLSRTLLLGVAGVLITVEGPAGAVYVLAGVAGLAAAAFRPAQAAALPAYADRPDDLTAANLVSTTIESAGLLAGPALGGVLLALASPEAVFFFAAAASLWSAALLTGLPRQAAPAASDRGQAEGESLLREVFAGAAAIAGDARLRVLVGLPTALTVVWGALTVLIVLIPLRLLDGEESAVGFLNAAVGVGGVVGAAATLSLVGARRLTPGLAVAIALWSLPLLALSAWPTAATAAVFFALVGAGNTLAEVTMVTLLQRVAPERVLARVFAVVESLLYAGVGIGAAITPLIVAGVGVRGALVVVSVPMLVLLGLTWRRLREVDAAAPPATDRLALLRGVPIFAPLGGPALEWLAGVLDPVDLGSGEVIARQGEPGERFYIVARGGLEVEVDGRHVRTLGVGDSFGEVALVREVPRTATVAGGTDGATLLALDRNAFLAAVMANPDSARAASDIAATRLAAFRPRGLMV